VNGGITNIDGGAMFGVVPKAFYGQKNMKSMRIIKSLYQHTQF
jgi:hypothetical protein